MKKKKHRIISLFSGCGGMDLGMEGGFKFLGKNYKPTNYTVVWANDINKYACKTFRRNFIEKRMHVNGRTPILVEGDIEKLDSLDMPKQCDIVVGGFPCQDFSITRVTKREGVKVKRGKLYRFFVKTVKEKTPRVFIAENVKGILSANSGQAINLIAKELAHINGGYNIYCDLYNFADYGVPQTRQRVLIIGIRSDIEYVYKKPKPTVTVEKYVSSARALQGIDKNAHNHNFMRIRDSTVELLKAIPEGKNVNYLGSEHPLYVKGLMSNIYRKLDRNKPSTTIIAAGGGGTWGYHYEEPRSLTNRERARLQTFPDTFEFEGSTAEVRRQIGNAVPPVGIYPVAIELKNAFSSRKGKPKQNVTINICSKEWTGKIRS